MIFLKPALFIRIAYFTVVLVFLSSSLYADEPMLREAATPSSQRSMPSYRDDISAARKGGRIGLSPVPYKPEESGKKEPEAVRGPSAYPDLRGLVKKVNRSVVAIRMLDGSSSWSLGSFGMTGEDSEGKAMGYGAGFIVSDSGHILTNEHVLRHGSRIEVELLEGKKFFAKVVQKDGKNDLALIKIDAPKELLHPVDFGNSDDVELGEWVVGIGNPYGIGQSLMMGIVSAKMRKVPGSGYPPLIQIDAAMNLGNSGGPLFNLNGKVIGINTILLWKSQGIGFATPINVAKQFLGQKQNPFTKSASVQPPGPFGPAADVPRPLREPFNPLDPPWKYSR